MVTGVKRETGRNPFKKLFFYVMMKITSRAILNWRDYAATLAKMACCTLLGDTHRDIQVGRDTIAH